MTRDEQIGILSILVHPVVPWTDRLREVDHEACLNVNRGVIAADALQILNSPLFLFGFHEI